MKKKEKHSKKNKKLRRILILFLSVIFIIGIIYIFNYFYTNFKNKNEDILSKVEIDETKITEQKSERILQLEELKKENEDIVGWLEIEGTNMNYPVLQGTDNSYYMTHNYKKEYSKDGSLFLDKAYDWNIPSSNLLIYGHNNKNGIMFQELLKYASEDFYREHPKMKFTTVFEDCEYEILSAFYSRVYYKSETNVFRYYFFVNANNEEEYNEFVNNAKKASIYETGVTAEYGDQLLTLSTCEYSQEDGRFAVVAKKIK